MMGAAVALTITFVVIEAVSGWFAHSLALLSDAGHNLADAAALGFSWYALWIASKPSHQGMTFGYHRVGVFAALANAVSLVLIAAFIGWEAIARIRQPEAANGAVMIAVVYWRESSDRPLAAQGSKDDLNIRSAYTTCSRRRVGVRRRDRRILVTMMRSAGGSGRLLLIATDSLQQLRRAARERDGALSKARRPD